MKLWNALNANIYSGLSIPNWTVNAGHIGQVFIVHMVSASNVIVIVPRASKLQKISWVDFRLVYDRWNGYRQHIIPRSEISSVTRYSKYIISIYHYIEIKTNNPLP